MHTHACWHSRLTGDSRLQKANKLGALAFGAVLPDGKHSFPTSPTWMMYAGDDTHCIENVPVLIWPKDYCQAFLAEARVFRQVYPVSLSMTCPKILPFVLDNIHTCCSLLWGAHNAVLPIFSFA